MNQQDGEYREVQFKSPADVWPNGDPDDPGRDDKYITVEYDLSDGTYTLTYHPNMGEWKMPHFTQNHAVLALRGAGYSFPQIAKILDETYNEAHAS